MKKTSEEVQRKVLELWLEGHTYREISSRLEISIGGISSLIDNVRKRTPDLDDLRRLNLEIRKQGSSIHDAIRGGKMLDKINLLGVNFSKLEALLKILSDVASERQVGVEKLVNASLQLMKLEAQSNKTYNEVIEDFEKKQTLTQNLELNARKIREESRKLDNEIGCLKNTLTKVTEELKLTIGTKKRLDRLNLEELAKLAEYAEREGSLDDRVMERQSELESLKRKIEFLRMNACNIEKIDRLLASRGSGFQCQYCGLLTWRTMSSRECKNLLLTNAPLTVKCLWCGQTTHYDLVKTLVALGLEILS